VEKRYGGLLALHLLQSKDTFTAYAESALREAMTIDRALDLATQHFGAQYLTSEPAEVQLRKLYSVILRRSSGASSSASTWRSCRARGPWRSCRSPSCARCQRP
jgi:hypothetical protein